MIADKYCIEFVTHCQKILPNSTRSVQVAILTTLNLFVDKLVLLKMSKVETSATDKKLLGEICDSLNKILSYCISKYTTRAFLYKHDFFMMMMMRGAHIMILLFLLRYFQVHQN